MEIWFSFATKAPSDRFSVSLMGIPITTFPLSRMEIPSIFTTTTFLIVTYVLGISESLILLILESRISIPRTYITTLPFLEDIYILSF